MRTSEREIELAEIRVVQERDASIARIRADLDREGSADCIGCGGPIGESRHAALPSAVRCVACQARHERGRRSIGGGHL